MFRSGEMVRPRGSRAASSEAETRSGVRVARARRRLARGGVRPSSEVEIRPRGRQALERGGDPVVRCLALELGGVSPEGVPRPAVWWAATAFWAVGPSPLQAATTRSVLCGLWVCLSIFIIFRKGCFPPLSGDPYGCPRQ
jgi:hypothetical protein